MFLKNIMFSDKNSIEVHTIVLLTHISSRRRKLFSEVFKIFKKEKNPFGTFLNKYNIHLLYNIDNYRWT